MRTLEKQLVHHTESRMSVVPWPVRTLRVRTRLGPGQDRVLLFISQILWSFSAATSGFSLRSRAAASAR